MNVNTPTEAVRAWLEALPAEKKPIVEALRRLIEAAALSAHEILYQETLRYRLTASGVGHLFSIAVFAAHVNLGFFFGGSLPDPERLLVGSGKRMRHIPIRSVQECENPAITSLLAQAWAEGLQRVEHLPSRARDAGLSPCRIFPLRERERADDVRMASLCPSTPARAAQQGGLGGERRLQADG